MNKEQRPVYISVTQYKFPVTAIASVLHRASGFILFLAIPILLGLLDWSLKSEQGFSQMVICVQHPVMKFVLWAILVAVIYHFFAGVRHMIMDLGLGESLRGGRISAYAVIIITIILAIIAGVGLW